MDERLDAAGRDGEMKNGAVANIGATARKSVRIITEGFEMLAPGAAPEASCDFETVAKFA